MISLGAGTIDNLPCWSFLDGILGFSCCAFAGRVTYVRPPVISTTLPFMYLD